MNFLFPPAEESEQSPILQTPQSPASQYLTSPSTPVTSNDEFGGEEDRNVAFEHFYSILKSKIEEDTEETIYLQQEWNSWSLTPEDWKKYSPLYQQLGLSEKEYLSFKRGSKIFSNLNKKLDFHNLEKIWNLADIDKDGALNRSEFVLALFLIEKLILGFQLPSSLPKSLLRQHKPLSEIHQVSPKSNKSSPSISGRSSPSFRFIFTGLTPKSSPELQSRKTLNANILEPTPTTPLLFYDQQINTRDLNRRKKKAQRKINPNLSIQQAMEKCGETLDEKVEITIFQYSESNLEYLEPKFVSEISDVPPEWAKVRWINLEGFNKSILQTLAKKFNLHELAIEDVQDVPQRPKIEHYPNHLLLVTQIISLKNDSLEREQVSLFLINHETSSTIITIQEGKEGDCWKKLRATLKNRKIERIADEDFLIYCLLDAIIDEIEPVMLNYSDKLEDIEIEMKETPSSQQLINSVRNILREVLFIKRNIQPMIIAVEKMLKPIEPIQAGPRSNLGRLGESYHFSSISRTYLRDSLDRLFRTNDNLDTMRDHGQTIETQHTAATEHRMTKTMYVLTIVSTIFLPLTFIAGVYGTNFVYFPELDWKYGYAYFWGICIGLVVLVLSLFKYLRFFSVSK